MTQTRHHLLLACIPLFLFILIHLLSPQPTAYDYYKRLADAFLHGNICLQDNPPWLNELIPIQGKGFCVVYPITPAFLFIPFLLFGISLPQTTLAHLVFSFTGLVVYAFFRKKKYTVFTSLFLSISWSLGTIFFSLSAVGSAWYIAQTIGALFIWLALYVFEPHKPAQLIISGILFSLAANSRLPLHLYGLYFLLVLFFTYYKKWKELCIALILFGIGFAPLFLIQRMYNLRRYGSFGDEGYYLIPGKFQEQDFKDGEFNVKNIPKHLQVFLFKLPVRIDTFPYLVPSYYGLSVFITSPFLIIALIWLIRQKRYPELGTIIAILLIEMSHGTVGFTQFGYRFALDVYPLLFLGFPKTMFRHKRLASIIIAVVIFSIVVNIWGVLSFYNDWFTW